MRKPNRDKSRFVSVVNGADACVAAWYVLRAKLRNGDFKNPFSDFEYLIKQIL
jgi:hypothetical protein